MNALKLEAPEKLQITNKSMVDAFVSKDFVKVGYNEAEVLFDPFKKRVVSALA